ncbi:chemotaxis protein CheB [Mucilaginibacter ginkgonis]|uniref:protein-glutamate methylesterase n=1 Tax=Mucilaginibacter ginkgonis TaxID=2682091 RepID=A0A6I4I5W8_9SPHI|nr:chemotaxis protein CheB [Mucilaginibacter ginkgonis]QQL50494.1 chemotaxis protein CheB [Mucilaginibacter ginkgonis]
MITANSVTTLDQIVLIGGSAGSLHVVISILSGLKRDLQIPIVIVIHRKNDAASNLGHLLDIRSHLRVKEADDKEIIQSGIVYLAAADYHLLVEQNKHFALDDSEKINFSRPSIDVTFQSIAEVFGAGVTAILLSGANADGVEGMRFIQQAGGKILVQDPDSAQVAFMPQSAVDELKLDKVLAIDDIAPYINAL